MAPETIFTCRVGQLLRVGKNLAFAATSALVGGVLPSLGGLGNTKNNPSRGKHSPKKSNRHEFIIDTLNSSNKAEEVRLF